MIDTFKLEVYLARYEFSAPYLLCCSDAQTMEMRELLALASDEDRALWDNLELSYTEAPGMPALKETIAQQLYAPLKGSNIACFAGAEDGIFCALSAICGPEDHAIVFTPCYQSLLEIPKMRGCAVTAIELKPENQWRIDIDAIKRALRPNTRCVVINFPHNPTGQIITQEELSALIALLEPRGIWLFSDEVYRLLGSPEKPWASPAANLYSRALSLGVMSKSFGMAGLRIGWIACQDEAMLEKIMRIKHYTSICNSAPSEILSLIALKNKDRILARNNEIVADNLTLLDAFFAKHSDLFSWVRPQGGCVGFVKYHGAESIEDFCERLIKQAGVLLLPGSVYDGPGNYFRIGFGRKNMPEALERLEAFLRG